MDANQGFLPKRIRSNVLDKEDAMRCNLFLKSKFLVFLVAVFTIPILTIPLFVSTASAEDPVIIIDPLPPEGEEPSCIRPGEPGGGTALHSPWLFLEHSGDEWESSTSYRLDVGTFIEDPCGVPDGIESVVAEGLTPFSPNFTLSYNAGGGSVFLPSYRYLHELSFPDDVVGKTFQYNITATNNDAGTVSAITHVLDQPRFIPLAKNIMYNLDLDKPWIGWLPVLYDHDLNPDTPNAEVDFYELRIVRDGITIYRTGYLPSSAYSPPYRSFEIPQDVLTEGEPVSLRIHAVNAEFSNGGWVVENRSQTSREFTLGGPFVAHPGVCTENIGPNPYGIEEGHQLQIWANANDPQGSENIKEVTEKILGASGPVYPLELTDTGPAHGILYSKFIPYEGQTGRWEITATNMDGYSSIGITHDLDKPRLIPLVNNIQVSDQSTTPTLTWDPVFFDHDLNPETEDVEVYGYRVLIMTSPTNTFFSGPWISTTNYTIPEGKLTVGEPVVFQIQALDAESAIEGYIVFENRSKTYFEFTPEFAFSELEQVDGTLIPGVTGYENRIQDDVYGDSAAVWTWPFYPSPFPTEAVDISIHVLDAPTSNLPGVQAYGTKFLYIDFDPPQPNPLPPMGLEILIPLAEPMCPYDLRYAPARILQTLELQRVDPATGTLVPAQSWIQTTSSLKPSSGYIPPPYIPCPEELQEQGCSRCGTSAIFHNVATFSKVVGVIGDMPGSGFVMIDISPGSDTNLINPNKQGVVPVAILGSESFDVSTIDVTSVLFGGNKNLIPPAHDLTDPTIYEGHLQDVNSDGFMDLVSHYSVPDAGIVCGDISAMLVGMTTSGESFQGFDTITTVGCKGKGK
jgi:hypothetical protein